MQIDNYPTALCLDAITLLTCSVLLIRYGRLSLMHPATMYLAFHYWCTTQRLIELTCGYHTAGGFDRDQIKVVEITHASSMFDLALFVMTCAWLIVAALDFERCGPLPSPCNWPRPNVRPFIFICVAVALVPLGLIGLAQNLSHAHAEAAGAMDKAAAGSWDASYATTMIQGWIGMALMPLFFLFGPRKALVAALVVIAVPVLLTGNDRWVITLPVIFVCYSYLSQLGLRWPPSRVVIALVIMALIWIPAKDVAQLVQKGRGADAVAATVGTSVENATVAGNSEDAQYLDMAAVIMSRVDQKGSFLLGQTFLPVLWNWIPRPLWPDKPHENGWLKDLSTSQRPLASYGITASLAGAAYVDGGYIGVIVICFLFAAFIGASYFFAFRRNHLSCARFVYLIYACTLLQPYRDGFGSFLQFNYIVMWPMMLIVLLHKLPPISPGQNRRVRLAEAQ